VLPLALVALLAAAPAVPLKAPPLKLALPGLTAVGIDAELGSFYSEHLAQQLKVAGLDVVTTKEIAVLLGMERQKQLLGCSEGSCIAEMAAALGADAVVLGDVAKVGNEVQLNLKVISATNGRTLATYTDRASNDDAVVDSLTKAAARFTIDVCTALGRPVPDGIHDLTVKNPLKRVGWVTLAGGVVAGGVGAGLLIKTNLDFQRMIHASPQMPLSSADAVAIRNNGPPLQTAGGVLAIVGGAAIVTGVALLVVSRKDAVAVAFVPTQTGGAFAIAGALP
jgi:hypothetical protein